MMLTQLCAILYKSPNIASRKVKELMAAKPSVKPIARLLVVDDEQDITTIIKKVLEGDKILVDEYTNSSQALKHFREHPNDYCMLVSDIGMPSPTGFELAKEIYKINPDVKILLMSSFEIHKSEFDKVLPSIRVEDFIQKPVSIAELKNTVLKHIGNTKRITSYSCDCIRK
jgi:DNA-binding NtrC family response regulator